MKNLYSTVITNIAFIVFASIVGAGPIPWSKVINEGRFKVLSEFNNEAVLDNETGLVWERSPDPSKERNWLDSQIFCNDKTVGKRKGWRLPTVQELGSLMDLTQSGPALTRGHPFKKVVAHHYWSATTSAFDPGNGWYININRGGVSLVPRSFPRYVWCVRAGEGGVFAAAAAGGQAWGKGRFKVLSEFNNEAVLDNETGLVWEQSPDRKRRTWAETQVFCVNKKVGKRKGWRVPTIHEIATLVDKTQSGPALPSGHPFIDVRKDRYSSTTPFNATNTWYIHLNRGGVSVLAKSYPRVAWCLRGGKSVDPL